MKEEEVTLKTLVNSYDLLPIADKRRELGREIAELSIVIKKLINDLIEDNILPDSIDEYGNLLNGNIGESEYLTGLYEDIVNLKELLGFYLSKTITDNYNDK